MYATQKMLHVQLPFQVDDIDDFWRNHEIQKRPDIIVNKMVPSWLKFVAIESPAVTVFYKDQEATISEYDYDNWFASWWAISGANTARKKLGLDLFATIPRSEFPIINIRP